MNHTFISSMSDTWKGHKSIDTSVSKSGEDHRTLNPFEAHLLYMFHHSFCRIGDIQRRDKTEGR
jgi:hypothetical protein